MTNPTPREAVTALVTAAVLDPGVPVVDLAAGYVADVPPAERMTFVIAMIAMLAAENAEQVRLVGRLAGQS